MLQGNTPNLLDGLSYTTCISDSYLAKHTDPEAAEWMVRGQRSNPFPNVRLRTPSQASFWSTRLWPLRRTDTAAQNPILKQ